MKQDKTEVSEIHDAIFGSTNVDFMNHGYYPASTLIKEEDNDFKNQFSLYLSLFDNITVKNKSILEVGCGRGGGIKKLSKYFTFSQVDACDIREKNIEYCKINNTENINFKVSNAEKLDYPDNSFDIIINVESSHGYNNFSLFFEEVNRVLKPDGIFLYADGGKTIQNFPNFFYLFKNIIRTDITENVANACKDDMENFKHLVVKDEVKEVLLSIAKNKYYENYYLKNNVYIKYACFNDQNWLVNNLNRREMI